MNRPNNRENSALAIQNLIRFVFYSEKLRFHGINSLKNIHIVFSFISKLMVMNETHDKNKIVHTLEFVMVF